LHAYCWREQEVLKSELLFSDSKFYDAANLVEFKVEISNAQELTTKLAEKAQRLAEADEKDKAEQKRQAEADEQRKREQKRKQTICSALVVEPLASPDGSSKCVHPVNALWRGGLPKRLRSQARVIEEKHRRMRQLASRSNRLTSRAVSLLP
jgi:hypothetical protein